MTYRIGTRGSKLALAQSNIVKARLEAACPGDRFEVVIITTHGDRVQDRPISAIGDNALFTREIETAILQGQVDFAVHSMKDLPAECPEGLALAKAWPREDPRDALVLANGKGTLADLPPGAVVATGSARRNVLLRKLRPDLKIADIRGNVDTRLRKLFSPQDGEPRLDGIVLALAGLRRLGREDVVSDRFDIESLLPAPNQGQLALELRADNAGLKAKLDALGDDAAEAVAQAERLFLREIGADCHIPVAAFAALESHEIVLRCAYAKCETDAPVFVRAIGSAPLAAAQDAARQVRKLVAGEVVLVGAGPGDPDLITVKGRSAIAEADCIVYDRLVAKELLARAKPGCECVYVGKASGCHTLPQDEINGLLVRMAMEHAKVVRLKGGDPFVFGRGSEEMAHLVAQGIRCSVVPGVTSAIAAAESMLIPITARGVAQGFVVRTAHGQSGEPLPLDFAGMLDPHTTYVFLMGLARVGEIADGLVDAGKPADTSAAVIGAATTSDARLAVGTLADIAVKVCRAGVVSPAVMLVGAVVGERRKLGFPLSGRRFLIPAIEGGSRRLAQLVRGLGGEVDEPVVGRIVPIADAIAESDLDGIDRVVFTSRNGRLALTDEVKAWIAARHMSVEDVRKVEPIGRTLHLTQPDADRVEGVRSIDVYRNEPVPIVSAIDLADYDAALFTCASSVRRTFEVAKGETVAVAIGSKTAAALSDAGANHVLVADRTDLEAVVSAVLGRFA